MEKRVAILGAHTAVGRALAELIAERELPISILRYTTLDHLAEDLFPIGPDAVASADCAVLAMPGADIRALGEKARGDGKPVLDLAGCFAGEAPYAWPILDAGAKLVDGEVRAIACGLAGPIAGALKALSSFEVERATIATYEGAAALDQRGMDELSEQVRALYTLAEPPMTALPGRLAFAAIPTVSDQELPFDHDQRLANEVVAALGPDAPELRITRVLVPSFSAEGAALELDAGAEVDQEKVEAAIRASRGLRLVREPAPSTADAIGRDDALVCRLRASPLRIGFFIAADRLRVGSATPAVLLVERWLGLDTPDAPEDGSVPDLGDS